MTNKYSAGSTTRLQARFRVNEVLTDPTTVLLITRDPDGTQQSFLSASGFSDQGTWDASSNTPALADGTGTTGHYYSVSAEGSQNLGSGSQSFTTDDYVYYDGDIWLKIPNPQSGTLTKESTGIYYYDLPLHKKKRWYYRFESAGTVHSAGENDFQVIESNIR